MPWRFTKRTAYLSGRVGPDAVLPLQDWLTTTRSPRVDLAGLSHLHAAVLQVLLDHRPLMSHPPAVPFLATWVAPLFSGKESLP